VRRPERGATGPGDDAPKPGNGAPELGQAVRTLVICAVSTTADLAAARTLFAEYGDMPHVGSRWPGRDADLAALPSPYVPPSGTILVGWLDGEPIGCVALGELEEERVCEMKRLYVRPTARGTGGGRALVERLLADAREMGYSLMRLDTAPELTAARTLYAALGFRSIPPYHDRYDDIVCYEREL
jgi:putative acetyltransferase